MVELGWLWLSAMESSVLLRHSQRLIVNPDVSSQHALTNIFAMLPVKAWELSGVGVVRCLHIQICNFDALAHREHGLTSTFALFCHFPLGVLFFIR